MKVTREDPSPSLPPVKRVSVRVGGRTVELDRTRSRRHFDLKISQDPMCPKNRVPMTAPELRELADAANLAAATLDD